MEQTSRVAVGLLLSLAVALAHGREDKFPAQDACSPTSRPQLNVWLSPRMPYSMSEWPRMHAVAQSLGFAVVVHRDSRVTSDEWQAATVATGWPAELKHAASAPTACTSTTSALNRAAVDHFPTAIVVNGHGVHPWPIQGVMPGHAWRAALQHRLKSTTDSPSACIEPVQYLALDGDNPQSELGSYERVSPDGRFILRSFSGAKVGQVSLVELPDSSGPQRLKRHVTPLRNEAFPVQGSWRFLVDIDGAHHRFADVLRFGASAKPLFRAGMTGFYAAASELTQSTSSTTVYIRSLSWPQGNPNGPGGDGDDAAVGPLQARTVAIEDDWPKSNSVRVVKDTGAQFICTNRSAVDGEIYALPMISVDGFEFSAVPQSPHIGQPSMRSYALAREPMSTHHPCALTHDLARAPSKAVFGFGSGTQATSLMAFTDNGQVKILDRQLNESFALPVSRRDVLASAFPGITADGRVIFAATWRDCEQTTCATQAGYVIADPNQIPQRLTAMTSNGHPVPSCITTTQVRAARSRFASFHQLEESPPMGQSSP